MDLLTSFLGHAFFPLSQNRWPISDTKDEEIARMPIRVTVQSSMAAVLCAALFSSLALAQSAAVTTVTGSITATGTDTTQITFSCTGMNPCIGTYNILYRNSGCSNSLSAVDVITITGLDLTRPGPVKGNVILTNVGFSDTRNADGTCSIKPDSFKDVALTFDGTWGGTNGTLNFPTQIDGSGSATVLSGTFAATTAVPIQPTPFTTVNGSINATGIGGQIAQFTFTCKGANPCTGTYKGLLNSSGCSNSFNLFDVVTILGLDLAQSGAIQGELTLKNAGFNDSKNADGTCSVRSETIRNIRLPFGGIWNGTNGTLTFPQRTDGDGTAIVLTGAFSATRVVPVPVFPLVVTGAASVATPVATVTANIQYRPQDVGSTGSVYVFALAPASLVKNVSAEALINHKGPVTRGTSTTSAPLPCVLAQLTASGQLTAVTAGSLQAYLTGVLSSQGATVSVLNGVSTALLSGSVFYVGYGTSSTAMINGGINRNVVSVPGTQVCQPQAPQSGWWWYPAQDGRGFGIEVRGNTLFMSGYLYDDTGHATWVVSAGQTSLDGSFFNNTLYHVSNGQTLTGAYKAPAPVTLDGQITLSFTDARNGTLIWPGGSIPIQRFDDVIGSGNGITPAFVPENGWWWNESESGRGFFMEFKNNFAFIAGYMYEADGRPVWYTAQSTMASPQLLSTNWLQVANGQTLTGPYKKPVVINSNVGPVTIQFNDAANAVLTLPGGRNVVITRHRF